MNPQVGSKNGLQPAREKITRSGNHLHRTQRFHLCILVYKVHYRWCLLSFFPTKQVEEHHKNKILVHDGGLVADPY